MRYLLVFLSTLAHAEDRCVSTYDNKHPVVSMLESSTGANLISSQWSICGGYAYMDATKCKEPVGTRFKVELVKSKLVLTVNGLSDADVDKLAGATPGMGKMIKGMLASQGFPFNASLCARADNTAYVSLVGSGMTKGKGGIIELSKDAQGIRVSENLGNENGAAK